MGKSLLSIHVLDSTSDAVWPCIYELNINGRYRDESDKFIAGYVQARSDSGIGDYDEDDMEMVAKDILFFQKYLRENCVEHNETFYVVQSGKNVSVFSTYFSYTEIDDDIKSLFADCNKKIIAISVLDEDFLLIGFYEGAEKKTALTVGTNIQDVYGLLPSVPDTDYIHRLFAIDFESVVSYAPDYMKMLDELAKQTGLPVNLSIDDLPRRFRPEEIETETLSL